MFVIFGTSSEFHHIAETEKKLCTCCGTEKQFKLGVQYESFHLFFVPVRAYGKIYLNLCSNCNRGDILNTEETEVKLGGNAIPWMSRFGWTIPFGFVFGLMAILLLVGNLAKLIPPR